MDQTICWNLWTKAIFHIGINSNIKWAKINKIKILSSILSQRAEICCLEKEPSFTNKMCWLCTPSAKRWWTIVTSKMVVYSKIDSGRSKVRMTDHTCNINTNNSQHIIHISFLTVLKYDGMIEMWDGVIYNVL